MTLESLFRKSMSARIAAVIFLCLVMTSTVTGESGFTKGREIEPLPSELKPGDYVWIPEISPAGPVVVIVSIPDQEMYVYRNSVQIGRSSFVLDKKASVSGSHIYSALDGMDSNGARDWLAVTSIGGGDVPDLKTLANSTKIPSKFLENVRAVIAPGTTLILTEFPVSPQTRSEQDFRILTTELAQPQSKP